MTSELTEKICQSVDESYLLDLLKQMVTIDSRIGNEATLSEFVGRHLEELGLVVEYDRVEEDRFNVYASLQFGSSDKILTLNGHLDTVMIADGWDSNPFEPILKDELLFGLGVSDMKAGLACQLTALKALIEHQHELSETNGTTGTIHFTAVVDEEGHGAGAKKMAQHPKYGRTDGIIIAEPFFGDTTLDGLPLGMTGKVLYEINVQGQSAHAFRPELGINAITDAARIVEAIDQIYHIPDDDIVGFDPARDPDFGEGSFCVLKIEGGYTTYNVTVPQSCQIILNRLILPHETKRSVLADLRELVDRLDLASTVEIALRPPSYEAYKISEDHPLYQALEQSYREVFNRQPVTIHNKMISDANIFMGEYDIPTVNFGPKGYNLHGANEHVDTATLVPTAQVFIRHFLAFTRS